MHPNNKLPVGLRLARIARALDYGKKDLAYIGPTFKSMAVSGNTVTVTFDHADGGLVASGPVGGFMVAGDDKVFEPVAATWWQPGRPAGSTIATPVAVRYGYADDPRPPCNLYGPDRPACRSLSHGQRKSPHRSSREVMAWENKGQVHFHTLSQNLGVRPTTEIVLFPSLSQ